MSRDSTLTKQNHQCGWNKAVQALQRFVLPKSHYETNSRSALKWYARATGRYNCTDGEGRLHPASQRQSFLISAGSGSKIKMPKLIGTKKILRQIEIHLLNASELVSIAGASRILRRKK
jgi:hypothetical protein